MPGNTSNLNDPREVAYNFGLNSYNFNVNICIEYMQFEHISM